MKDKFKKILLTTLLFMPTMVYASSGELNFSIPVALGMEAFVTIHMSIFVLKPLSVIYGKNDSDKLFWKLFVARIILLLFFDFTGSTNIAVIDFVAVFVGTFIVVPLSAYMNKSKIPDVSNPILKVVNDSNVNQQAQEISDAVNGTKVAEEKVVEKVVVKRSSFDQIYSLPEERVLEEFINRELTKAGIDKTSPLIPSEISKRKTILNIIFSVLIFVYVTLIFFHFPIFTYIIGIILLFIFFRCTRKYDLMDFLKKQVKERPGEKISNIIMNVKNTSVSDNSKNILLYGLVIACVLPLLIFMTPKIIYEKVDGGYAVRYYAFGLTNFKTATIPEEHNGEKVVGLRGNTFSNMFFLESVKLPNTIKEIRGQAFKNCFSLKKVNIPSILEYLGGGAFYNAKSIQYIVLPDTLTYLGGESFYGASSLKKIQLSNNLEEIRGDSFEYCTSLTSITIPDSVTRIGGHAFYGDKALTEVIINENSKLTEIGSSAFRQCSNLSSIKIPKNTFVNERAFKESPTVVTRYGYDYSYEDNYSYSY